MSTENNLDGVTVTPEKQPEEQKGTPPNKELEVFKIFTTQKEFDDHAAAIKGNAERKAAQEVLAKLGLKSGDEEKLSQYKEAFESKLSDAEKTSLEIERLKEEIQKLSATLEAKDKIIAEKEGAITAICEVGGVKIESVNKIIKMAKGLVDAETDINAAIKSVLSEMNHGAVDESGERKTILGMPEGKPLLQPDPRKEKEYNPFKDGNMTEQMRLVKQDRKKAEKMAAAAGVTIFGKPLQKKKE